MDSLASHVRVSVLTFARQHRILLILIPQHTSHYLQPLEVGIYGPLKTVAGSLSLDHRSSIETADANMRTSLLLTIYYKAREQVLGNPDNIISAWSKSGLYPLDVLRPVVDKWFPSASFTNTPHEFEDSAEDDVLTSISTPIFDSSDNSLNKTRRIIDDAPSLEAYADICSRHEREVEKAIDTLLPAESCNDSLKRLLDRFQNGGVDKAQMFAAFDLVNDTYVLQMKLLHKSYKLLRYEIAGDATEELATEMVTA